MFNSMFKDLQAFYAARHEPESMRPLAEVYWRMLLMIALIMAFAVIAYGSWEFFGVINNLSAADATGPARSATLDRSALRQTLQSLGERQQKFNTGHAEAIPDPSR